ncbi:hypothetical protein NDU88_000485 [Pleurodeles waltl]|uniref:Uncharacterized protein n=1 Tax=Pleurodeles waltl TaxID=8319 RepID=A0AAV7TGX3_PLEWA|nr:hypothetical protein NDU88_000485 [Pleurodeles waltl]
MPPGVLTQPWRKGAQVSTAISELLGVKPCSTWLGRVGTATAWMRSTQETQKTPVLQVGQATAVRNCTGASWGAQVCHTRKNPRLGTGSTRGRNLLPNILPNGESLKKSDCSMGGPLRPMPPKDAADPITRPTVEMTPTMLTLQDVLQAIAASRTALLVKIDRLSIDLGLL